MNNNEPENRMKEQEIEESNLSSGKISTDFQKEMSFRLAIENSIPSGIAVIDDTGKQVYANKSFCKMVGRDEDELLGIRPPYPYWAQQDIENINIAFKLTLENKAPKEGFDLIFCHKTGKLVPVNLIISPLVQDNNKTFWVANIIDITERKKEEEALKKSQLLLKCSMENLQGTIVFAIDREYKYLFFNKAHWEAMKFAYNADVNTGMNILDCITSDDDRKLAKKNYKRSLMGESHSVIQTFGEVNVAYYESFFNPIVNETDEIIGCTGLARNITERIEAENALKESETKFREIIAQINDGINVFDEQGKIIIWNKGAENITGLKAEEVLNKHMADIRYQFTPPEIRDRDKIGNVINGIVTLQSPEMFNRIIDHEVISLNPPKLRNVQSTVFPIKLSGGNLFCGVIRDTTEIKRYEKELHKIIEDKDKFYSTIAQYLYTPFSMFNNFSKLMADEIDNLPIKEIQKMALMMSKSASNLFGLLDNLLQWTRMNQGNITLRPQQLNFLSISRDAVSILKPNAEEKKITINYLAPEEITVYADIFMFKTILRNLVSNAIKFSNVGGQVNISAIQSAPNIVITVSENGTGVAQEYVNKMFNILNINRSIGGEEEKGLTLGLMLSKNFVEKHGGKIWAESSKDNSVEVKFTLPIFTKTVGDINN